MKFAQIEFSNTADAAKALHGIMQRGRITGLADGTFIVPDPALAWLKEQNIPCRVLRLLNQDDVLQRLRNSSAHTV
jgi:hypothetical protein